MLLLNKHYTLYDLNVVSFGTYNLKHHESKTTEETLLLCKGKAQFNLHHHSFQFESFLGRISHWQSNFIVG